MSESWKPHPGPQTEFCSRWEFEAFYGGQAGPGKTDCLIMEGTRYVSKPNYRALILRRTFPQLQEIIDRSRIRFPLMQGYYRSGEHRWYWPSGAIITLGHIQHDGDEYNYQGKEYQYIGFDEVTQFLRKQYLYLFSRCRSTDPSIPCRVRSASNPGGIGHAFIKDRFKIGLIKPGTTIIDKDTGLSRVFIPGKLSDNPSLLLNDPNYVNRLMSLPMIERMRLLEGLWDAFEGQAIPELNIDVHGIDPFEIPAEWPRYRTFDWGYATPSACCWFAVDFEGRPYLYREYYVSKYTDMPIDENLNVGLRMPAIDVARKILEIEKPEREKGIKIKPGPADPDIWNPRWQKIGKKNFGLVGGSIAEDMANEGVHFLQADNDRIQGRQQVHKRLELDEKGDPQVFIFNNCTHFWRTMPELRESEHNPEDIEDKDVEDHIYSCFRYFCMFKPVKAKMRPKEDINTFRAERRKLIKAKQLAARSGMSIEQAYGRVR